MNSGHKRPESVLVVIFTDAGEVLLLRRREPADFWQSVTGSLEWGEQADAAAQRELQEETGLGGEYRPLPTGHVERFPIHPAWRHRYATEVSENVEYCYQLRLPHAMPIRLNPAEHQAFAWLPRAEALRRASSWTNRAAIERLTSEACAK